MESANVVKKKIVFEASERDHARVKIAAVRAGKTLSDFVAEIVLNSPLVAGEKF